MATYEDIVASLSQAVERLETDNLELKASIAKLQKQVRQRELDAAYMYIHSNWLWIRWFLVRDQDRAGDNTDLLDRAKAAESTIRDNLARSLRSVQFDPEPMQAAYRWRIETTVILNRQRYTFFD